MSEIILYDQEGCTGKREDFYSDTPDLSVKFFNKVTRSVMVRENHWIAYTGKNYSGDCMIYGEGEHKKLGDFDKKISSLRLVNTDLTHPQIVLFEDPDFEGQSRTVDRRIDDLTTGGFEHLVSSHKVKTGVWLLYADVNCQGKRMVALEGEEVANYCAIGWNDKVASVRPLLASDYEA